MTRRLTIGLHDGGRITIQTDAPEEAIHLDGFAELMCLTPDLNLDPVSGPIDVQLVPSDALPPDRHTVKTNSLTEIAFAADWDRVLITGWKKAPRRPHFYDCYIWMTALIYAGMNAILRGEKAVLAHCAVLETPRGAVLLFGESGMGKSTASARWRAHGGQCVSDDMALLDFSAPDGVVRVRRMPTWSACREARNPWNYPVSDELPLAGLLALGRSESGRDEIVPLSFAQFFAQCYRSIFYWNLFYAKYLPDRKQTAVADFIRSCAENVTKQFAPRALLTVLEGDILKFIEDNL